MAVSTFLIPALLCVLLLSCHHHPQQTAPIPLRGFPGKTISPWPWQRGQWWYGRHQRPGPESLSGKWHRLLKEVR